MNVPCRKVVARWPAALALAALACGLALSYTCYYILLIRRTASWPGNIGVELYSTAAQRRAAKQAWLSHLATHRLGTAP